MSKNYISSRFCFLLSRMHLEWSDPAHKKDHGFLIYTEETCTILRTFIQVLFCKENAMTLVIFTIPSDLCTLISTGQLAWIHSEDAGNTKPQHQKIRFHSSHMRKLKKQFADEDTVIFFASLASEP